MNLKLVSILLAASFSASAADPFSCVDPDVRAVFLDFPSQTLMEYSTTLLPGFSSVEMPESFSLVGSSRAGTSLHAAYTTTKSSQEALDLTVDAFTDAGWTESLSMSQRGRTSVFQSSRTPRNTVLCHAAIEGQVNLQTSTTEQTTLMNIYQNTSSVDPLCIEGSESHPFGLAMRSIVDHMPTFTMPQKTGVAVTPEEGGGSSRYYKASVVVTGPITRKALIGALTEQIRAQGWVRESDWEGESSSGSMWVKFIEPDTRYFGSLTAVSTGEATLVVEFSVTNLHAAVSRGQSLSAYSVSGG